MDIIHSKVLIKHCQLYDIYRYQIDPPIPIKQEFNSIGFDPGTVHMGIALIWRTLAYAYEVKVLRSSDAVERILTVHSILSDSIKYFDYAPILTIEGSSFGSNYRNTELAEIRASAVLWGIQHSMKPRILPPMTIRKVVFGSGKVKAEDTWTFIPPNAASALACACYPFMISAPSTKE